MYLLYHKFINAQCYCVGLYIATRFVRNCHLALQQCKQISGIIKLSRRIEISIVHSSALIGFKFKKIRTQRNEIMDSLNFPINLMEAIPMCHQDLIKIRKYPSNTTSFIMIRVATCFDPIKYQTQNCLYLLRVNIVWDPKNVRSFLANWFIVKADDDDDDPIGSKHVATLIIIKLVMLDGYFLIFISSQ